MDFLPRHFITGALFGALCLVSVPAFPSAIPASDPGYIWEFDNAGAKLVFAPSSPISQNINVAPANAFTPAANAADGVIETIAAPALDLGNSGLSASGISLSRGLSVGDLIDGAKALMVPDNPYGAAFLGLTLVGQLALDAFDAANAPTSSTYVPSPDYYCGSTAMTAPSGYDWEPAGSYCSTGSPAVCGGSNGCYGHIDTYLCSPNNVAPAVNAPACSNGATPSVGPNGSSSVSPETPAQAIQWAQANPSSFATNVAPTLNGSPADQISLAEDEAANNAPLPAPVPFSYLPNPNPDVVTGSPTIQTSTDPTTGNTTQTTTTPSYRVAPSPSTSSPSLDITKSTTSITQTCTSSGSCTSSPPVITTAPTNIPNISPFVAPVVSAPTASTVSPTPFALNLAMPSQSVAVCPDPLSYNAFGTAFTIPLSPLCTLATDVRPYVESLGAVGAGIVIFR